VIGQEVEPEEITEVTPVAIAEPVNDDLEKLLAEEEDIERRTRDGHHEAPHFKREVD
jgi:small subunit ribosomal protein S3